MSATHRQAQPDPVDGSYARAETGPYLVLFGADEAQLSPLQVGVFMSVIAVSGLAVSTWLGRATTGPPAERRRSSRWRHRRSATWR